MSPAANDIIKLLEREILPLQGYKAHKGCGLRIGFEPIENAFPIRAFPTGAIHDFTTSCCEDAAATAGFIAALLSKLMQQGSPCVWIGNSSLFPPALALFDVVPERIIFIETRQQKEALWITEEALKCDRLCAVIGEVKDISLTESRRLQLAVEQSGVTGLLLRPQLKINHIIASVSRWRITPLPTLTTDALPGVGFPRWNVDLLKVRNGKPGSWQIEWTPMGFKAIPTADARAAVVKLPKTFVRNTG